MKTTILSIIATLITFNSLLANVPSENVEKEKPTQAKPSLPNGIPPRKPSIEVTSKLDESSLVDFPAKIQELESSLKDMQTKLTKSELTISELNNKITNLESDNQLLETKNESITEERNRYYSQLQSKNNEISSLKTQNQTLVLEMNELSVSNAIPSGSIFNGWVYTTDFGWAFLSPETMPYVFLQKDGWVYYERGSNPRRVYYFDTETWKEYE